MMLDEQKERFNTAVSKAQERAEGLKKQEDEEDEIIQQLLRERAGTNGLGTTGDGTGLHSDSGSIGDSSSSSDKQLMDEETPKKKTDKSKDMTKAIAPKHKKETQRVETPVKKDKISKKKKSTVIKEEAEPDVEPPGTSSKKEKKKAAKLKEGNADEPAIEHKATKKHKKNKKSKKDVAVEVEVERNVQDEEAVAESEKTKKEKKRKRDSEAIDEPGVTEECPKKDSKKEKPRKRDAKVGAEAIAKPEAEAGEPQPNTNKAEKSSKRDKKRKRESRAAAEPETEAASSKKSKKEKSKKEKEVDAPEASAPVAKEKAVATAAEAEQWNVKELEGGESRQAKFLRLLGGKKAGAAAATKVGAVSSRPHLDINKASKELEQQFEAGRRMKFDVGGQHKGLGA